MKKSGKNEKLRHMFECSFMIFHHDKMNNTWSKKVCFSAFKRKKKLNEECGGYELLYIHIPIHLLSPLLPHYD